jgi:TolA-binding protein
MPTQTICIVCKEQGFPTFTFSSLFVSEQHSAQAAVEDSDRIFTELIHSIERRRSELKELIRDQEKAQVSQADGLLEQLEQEIAELRRRNAELEQLSHTEDHIHFLQVTKLP